MTKKIRPSVPSHPSLCLDDREHRVEDFYDDDECWACGLPLQTYWVWYTEAVAGEQTSEEDDSAAASRGFARPVTVSRQDGCGVERFFG